MSIEKVIFTIIITLFFVVVFYRNQTLRDLFLIEQPLPLGTEIVNPRIVLF